MFHLQAAPKNNGVCVYTTPHSFPFCVATVKVTFLNKSAQFFENFIEPA